MRSSCKHLKVIDLSTVLAGPSVGTFFAELGAEVIKVENPKNPDVTRSWRLPAENKDEVSAYFSSVNFGKKYHQLNLKDVADRNQLYALLVNTDIVLMNFKHGDQEKLGITDELLFRQNPQLIIGKISGFGDDSDRVAYDLILQAESGMMSMNGNDKSGPLKMPIAFIDILAGHHLKEGILLALWEKEQKKEGFKGKSISVSLYEAAISSLTNQASNFLMAGKIPERIGSLHPNIAPYGELFTTKDGGLITFAIGSNRHFELLCSFLRKPLIAKDDRYKDAQSRVNHRKDLFQEIQYLVGQMEAQEILDGMRELHVPCAKIKNLKEVFKDTLAQSMILEEQMGGTTTKRGSAIAFRTKN
jgi:crotonobetainyl-CoA:carnitine CoA-transferase CaiB-like acyl-CoA transferase